jgi:lipopolysaccharide export system protein LptA
MRYKADGLELWADVKLTFRREGARPTEIEAGNASLSRQENRVYFNDGVLVRQGGREVRSGRLQLNMADEFRIIEHAAAIEDVFVRIGSGADVPGARIGAAPGEKQLRCRRLNVGFDEKGAIREATGINPATLDLLPGPGETESRRLTAHRIAFAIDERGVLTQVQAYAGERPDDVQTVVFTSTAGPAPASTRRVECRYIGLMIDAESGRLARAIFDKQVVFSEPGRKGWADRSVYDGSSGKLSLEGREPRIVEEKDGSELRAGRIEIGTQTRSVSAFDNVRHTINRRRSNAPAAARGTAVVDEPTVVVARRFEYDAAKRSARYSENALLRSGKDEIRAPLIVIEEPSEGHRKLTASGGVTSTLHAKRSAAAKKDPAPIESRSKELVYDESAHRAVYTGDVEVRQGDIQTVSPEVVVLLGREEGSVERVLAGAPVDLRQGARRATGERATYTPADETVVLVGEKVVVQDADRRAEGRVLTFQVGSDRIRLDGRDEVRTEAVLKRRDPPKP